MILDEVEIRHVELEMVNPFETSFGQIAGRHTIILRIRSGEHTAWGEAPVLRDPFYNAEFTAGTFVLLRDVLGPLVVGREIASPADLHALMKPVRGNQMAKGGLDTAVCVLFAEAEGLSLSKYLGGTQEKIASGVSIGLQRDDKGEVSIDRLLEAVQSRLDDSYQRIKIKIKPGYDVAPVKAIRDAFGDDLPLQVDGNSAYTLEDVDVFRKLDKFGLMLIEQPLAHDDIFDHAKLQAAIETPICLDESIESVEDARHAIELKSCRIINIKHTRVGGLYPAKAVHDLCAEHDIPVWCGGMLESAIGQCHALAIASLPNFTMAADCAPSERYFRRDLIRPFVQLEDGTLDVPTAPGLGFEVDEAFVEECTRQKAVVSR